ncbi:MAG TPA: transketolase C-terminal domain-containing protein, partial [Deferrisomatales bacterium]|nr:transketolase C-terminal domain-containing protein [Deferrisomatales bacterium]
ALATAVSLGRPVAVRYPRGCGTGCSLEGPPEQLPLGKGRLVRGSAENPGVLVLSCGTVLEAALEAVRQVSEKGVQAAVFDVRYVKPLDGEAILALAGRASGVVTVEENALAGGFGSAVLELLAASGAGCPPVRRVGLPDRFVEHGTQGELRSALGLDAPGIREAILAMDAKARG